MYTERVEHYRTVGSTNAIALERARSGETGGLWIQADVQEGGRGRLGRTWVSEPGNLFCSAILQPEVDPRQWGVLPLVVAVAVHDAVSAVLPPLQRSALQIKWPNDLLFAGAKVCGMLLEGLHEPGAKAVIVGIGINCQSAPPPGVALYPSSSLAAAGFVVDPQHLFGHVRRCLRQRTEQWEREGFDPIRSSWLVRAAGLGSSITARLPHIQHQGVFSGLDPAGYLLLDLADGSQMRISAGDVFL